MFLNKKVMPLSKKVLFLSKTTLIFATWEAKSNA
jgi:hypothetical protein